MSTTPQPPYPGVAMPDGFRETPFEELPPALKRRVLVAQRAQAPTVE